MAGPEEQGGHPILPIQLSLAFYISFLSLLFENLGSCVLLEIAWIYFTHPRPFYPVTEISIFLEHQKWMRNPPNFASAMKKILKYEDYNCSWPLLNTMAFSNGRELNTF